jgi:hypothetical protein
MQKDTVAIQTEKTSRFYIAIEGSRNAGKPLGTPDSGPSRYEKLHLLRYTIAYSDMSD